MRFGVCTGIENAELLKEVGYDYIELSVASDLIPEADEHDWNAQRLKIEAMPLVAETFNSFVRTLKIIGADVDTERLRRYVDVALERAAQVGGEIIVFGSGGAREIPDGFSLETANRQMEAFLNLCADASERTGVVVAIEPLQHGECNSINLVSEGAAWARQINRSGVRVLADTFHMERENEPLKAIVSARDVLAHAHTADTNRHAPGTGTYDHAAMFRAFTTAGYDARLSIECDWQDRLAEDAAVSLIHLKEKFKG